MSTCPAHTYFPVHPLPGNECKNMAQAEKCESSQFCMGDACDSVSPAFPGVAPSVAAGLCSQVCVWMVSLALTAVSSATFYAHAERGKGGWLSFFLQISHVGIMTSQYLGN